MTKAMCAGYLGISLRSYNDYENNKSKVGSIKYNYIMQKLAEYNSLDEEHGILTLKEIIEITTTIFKKYEINFCYLFG